MSRAQSKAETSPLVVATRRMSLAALLALPAVCAWQARAQQVAEGDATTVDSDGTTHIIRAIPVPKTLSPEAYAMLVTAERWAPDGWTRESAGLVEKMRAVYPVKIEQANLAGVKVKIVDPQKPAPNKGDRVLINLHGGGFTSDSGSLLESIPIASLTGTRVIAVEYRLAPQFPFPAAVDDSVAVFKELLKSHSPKKVAIYGTSAGAILTAQTAVQLAKLKLPLPAALGFFSGSADFSRSGDSRYLYSVRGFKDFKAPSGPASSAYVGKHDPRDPVLSPIYADLKGFPPTLCMTGIRDMLLSGTADFHRALLRAGVDARLIVFDALPHAHWYSFHLPESKEALEAQASFLDRYLG
jgi:monoterpene epsilon-lactone hydrolase